MGATRSAPVPSLDVSPPATQEFAGPHTEPGITRPPPAADMPLVAPSTVPTTPVGSHEQQPFAAASESQHQPTLPANAPEIPKVSLELPPDSGLVLVETSRERVALAPITDVEPEPQRPRRMRPLRVEIPEEPLQMVETVHKEPTPPAR